MIVFNMKDLIGRYVLGNNYSRNSLAYLNHSPSRRKNSKTMVKAMTHTLKRSALCPTPQTLNLGIIP